VGNWGCLILVQHICRGARGCRLRRASSRCVGGQGCLPLFGFSGGFLWKEVRGGFVLCFMMGICAGGGRCWVRVLEIVGLRS
jgi:hypothetical protein